MYFKIMDFEFYVNGCGIEYFTSQIKIQNMCSRITN